MGYFDGMLYPGLFCGGCWVTIFNVYIILQFLSISYWNNSELWSQKCTQNGNIH